MSQIEMFASNGPTPVERDSPSTQWPNWFHPSKHAKIHSRRVALGRHPFGESLSDWIGATCGNCGHLQRRKWSTRTYLKCAKVPATKGPASDARAMWRGCSEWAPGTYNAGLALGLLDVLISSLRETDEGRDAIVAADVLAEQSASRFGFAEHAHAVRMLALYKAEGCKGIVRALLDGGES